jgi:GNAT superfamily N-acetyltransferase
MKKEFLTTINNISNWSPKDGIEIYKQLEILNWAPWLAASPESLSGRAIVFSQGQLKITEPGGNIIASLSTNRIHWNGDVGSLPSWDDVAGDPTDYSKTYQPNGNTLVLMSMNVHPDYRGLGLARELIRQARKVAKNLEVNYLIGSFRPNEFGNFKLIGNNWSVPFEKYCNMIREDCLPIDSWLRNLVRNGMIPLTVDQNAMTVTVPLDQFNHYRTSYNPDNWKEVWPGLWECGEVGRWTVNHIDSTATYKESNLWGLLPIIIN